MTDIKTLEEILKGYEVINTSHLYHHEHDKEKLIEALNLYIEERERLARIDELKMLDTLTYSFMSLGHDFDYSYRQSAVDTRIKELEQLKDSKGKEK